MYIYIYISDEHLAKSDDNFQPIPENACKKIIKVSKNALKKFKQMINKCKKCEEKMTNNWFWHPSVGC